jgi:hypothetical protein
LVAKWDSINKHASKKKAHDGKWFMDPKGKHEKKWNCLCLTVNNNYFSNSLI